MSIPSQLLTTTCDVYRPFGAGAPTTAGVPCRMVADLAGGTLRAGAGLFWTHFIDVQNAVDVRDGCTRTVGIDAVNFFDGDEVRVPGGAGTTRYVVVWVETINRGTSMPFQRVYLLRDTPVWPNP